MSSSHNTPTEPSGDPADLTSSASSLRSPLSSSQSSAKRSSKPAVTYKIGSIDSSSDDDASHKTNGKNMTSQTTTQPQQNTTLNPTKTDSDRVKRGHSSIPINNASLQRNQSMLQRTGSMVGQNNALLRTGSNIGPNNALLRTGSNIGQNNALLRTGSMFGQGGGLTRADSILAPHNALARTGSSVSTWGMKNALEVMDDDLLNDLFRTEKVTQAPTRASYYPAFNALQHMGSSMMMIDENGKSKKDKKGKKDKKDKKSSKKKEEKSLPLLRNRSSEHRSGHVSSLLRTASSSTMTDYYISQLDSRVNSLAPSQTDKNDKTYSKKSTKKVKKQSKGKSKSVKFASSSNSSGDEDPSLDKTPSTSIKRTPSLTKSNSALKPSPSSLTSSPSQPLDLSSTQYAWSTAKVDEDGGLLEIMAPPVDSTFLQSSGMTNVLISDTGHFGYLRPGYHRPKEWSQLVTKTWAQAWRRLDHWFEIPRLALSLTLLCCFIYLLSVSMNTEFLYMREGKDTWEQLILGDPILDWDLDDEDANPVGLDGQWDIFDVDTMVTIVNRTTRVYFASISSVDRFERIQPFVSCEFEHDAPYKELLMSPQFNSYQLLQLGRSQEQQKMYENDLDNYIDPFVSSSFYDLSLVQQEQSPFYQPQIVTFDNDEFISTLSTPGTPNDSNRSIRTKQLTTPQSILQKNIDNYKTSLLQNNKKSLQSTQKSIFSQSNQQLRKLFNNININQTNGNSNIIEKQKQKSLKMSQQSIAFNTHQDNIKSRPKNTMLRSNGKKTSSNVISNPESISTTSPPSTLPLSPLTTSSSRRPITLPHSTMKSTSINNNSTVITLNNSDDRIPMTRFNLSVNDLGPFQTAREDPDTFLEFIQTTHVSKITLSYTLRHYTFHSSRSCMEWVVSVVFEVTPDRGVSGQIFADDVFCHNTPGSPIITGQLTTFSHPIMMAIMCGIAWCLVALYGWRSLRALVLNIKILYYYFVLHNARRNLVSAVTTYRYDSQHQLNQQNNNAEAIKMLENKKKLDQQKAKAAKELEKYETLEFKFNTKMQLSQATINSLELSLALLRQEIITQQSNTNDIAGDMDVGGENGHNANTMKQMSKIQKKIIQEKKKMKNLEDKFSKSTVKPSQLHSNTTGTSVPQQARQDTVKQQGSINSTSTSASTPQFHSSVSANSTIPMFDDVSFNIDPDYKEPILVSGTIPHGNTPHHQQQQQQNDNPSFGVGLQSPGKSSTVATTSASKLINDPSLVGLSYTPSDGVWLNQQPNAVQLQPLDPNHKQKKPSTAQPQPLQSPQSNIPTPQYPNEVIAPQYPNEVIAASPQQPRESDIHLLYVDIATPLGQNILTTYLQIKATYTHYHNLQQRRDHPFYQISFTYLTLLSSYAVILSIFVAMAVFDQLEISRDGFTIQLIFSSLAFGSALLIMPSFSTFPRQYTIWQKTVWTALPYLIPLIIGNFPVFMGFSLFSWLMFSPIAPRFETLGFSATHLFAVMKGDEVLDVFTEVFQNEGSWGKRVIGRVFLYLFSLYFLLVLYKMIFGVVAFFLVGDDVDEEDLSVEERMHTNILPVDEHGNVLAIPVVDYRGNSAGRDDLAFMFERANMQQNLVQQYEEMMLIQSQLEQLQLIKQAHLDGTYDPALFMSYAQDNDNNDNDNDDANDVEDGQHSLTNETQRAINEILNQELSPEDLVVKIDDMLLILQSKHQEYQEGLEEFQAKEDQFNDKSFFKAYNRERDLHFKQEQEQEEQYMKYMYFINHLKAKDGNESRTRSSHRDDDDDESSPQVDLDHLNPSLNDTDTLSTNSIFTVIHSPQQQQQQQEQQQPSHPQQQITGINDGGYGNAYESLGVSSGVNLSTPGTLVSDPIMSKPSPSDIRALKQQHATFIAQLNQLSIEQASQQQLGQPLLQQQQQQYQYNSTHQDPYHPHANDLLLLDQVKLYSNVLFVFTRNGEIIQDDYLQDNFSSPSSKANQTNQHPITSSPNNSQNGYIPPLVPLQLNPGTSIGASNGEKTLKSSSPALSPMMAPLGESPSLAQPILESSMIVHSKGHQYAAVGSFQPKSYKRE